MEGSSKTSAAVVPVLPDDPLVEILSRVPAKSVCRFKCVSKAWRDLIADPDHRKKLPQAMQGLFVETGEVDESYSLIDLTVRSVPLDIDPSFFLTELIGTEACLLDSCNGLILFSRHPQKPCGSDPHHYTVCNPTTKQWSVVPSCGSGEPLTKTLPLSYTYLAFDPGVSSNFHLIQFQMLDVYKEIVALHVYSSETRAWSQNQIDGQTAQGQLKGWHHQFTLDIKTLHHLHAFVNGFLHVIVSRSKLWHILVVDVQGKPRRMIAVPGMADERPRHVCVCYLGQSQGHLNCMTIENDKLSIWVLQDYDTQEWVLKSIMDLNPMDVFEETGITSEFHVVDIHQDCNVVFFLRGYRKLRAYNMDRKEVSVIATFKDCKLQCDFARYIPYFSESPAFTNKH